MGDTALGLMTILVLVAAGTVLAVLLRRRAVRNDPEFYTRPRKPEGTGGNGV